MSKNKTVEETAVVLTHVGLGVVKHDTLGWSVVKLKYNPDTKDATVEDVVHAGPSRDFAIEKFKLLAVEEGLVG